MKCIDPWLLNNRRQCPVCKRYVFPNNQNSDEEESNEHTATERTPLIPPNDENSATRPTTNRPYGPLNFIRSVPMITLFIFVLERRFFQSSTPGVSNRVFPSNESSDGDDEITSSTPTRQSHITTDSLVFEHSTLLAPDDSQTELLPNVIIRQPNSPEDSMTNATAYESVRDSLASSFTTPRAANFFVGSLGGATDNTNMSAHSVIEDSDVHDERMQSVLTDVDSNPGDVSDHQMTDLNQTDV